MELLKTGSTGALVELLQLALNRAGFGRLDTDGIFGAKTRAAVLRFQAYNGLAADGIVGTETRTALMPWYTGFFTHRAARRHAL